MDMPFHHFYLWREFIRRKFSERTPDHYYLAQIAREVFCVLLKADDRKRFKLDDFLLNFKTERKKVKKKKVRRVEYEDEEVIDIDGDEEARLEQVKLQTIWSKSMWFGITGIKAPALYGDKGPPVAGEAFGTKDEVKSNENDRTGTPSNQSGRRYQGLRTGNVTRSS